MIRYLAILNCLLGLAALAQAWWFLSLARAVGGYDAYYILLPSITPSLMCMLDFGALLPHVNNIPPAFALTIPVWLIAVLLIAYPAWTLIAKPLQTHYRRRRGLCVKCGYNLAGNTTGICPECGTKTALGNDAHP